MQKNKYILCIRPMTVKQVFLTLDNNNIFIPNITQTIFHLLISSTGKMNL